MTIFAQFLLAMIATITFAILFCAPRKELLLCSLSGAISWIVYYLIHQHTASPVFASLVATFILTIYSRVMAVLRQSPATTYLLTGIFPLVPGAGIYYTAYYMITEQSLLFSEKGLETFEVALAIVFGIILGFAIPQSLFLKLEKKEAAESK
jgi:uncharacterized membrane protein YjjB (DUF3815 family)